MNDRERLEKLQEDAILSFSNGSETYGLEKEDFDWLTQQAEEKQELPNLKWYEENGNKLAILNEFLQERNTGQVGDHVIDVVMEYVNELEKELEGITAHYNHASRQRNKSDDDRIRLKQQNKRYEEVIRESSKELENLYSRLSILGAEKEKESHLSTIEYVGLTLLRQALQNK